VRKVLKVTLIDSKHSVWSLDNCWTCFFNVIITETSEIKWVKVVSGIGWGGWVGWLWAKTRVCILLAHKVLGR
jgi:hypothetical protein